jgi:hypothetical protein
MRRAAWGRDHVAIQIYASARMVSFLIAATLFLAVFLQGQAQTSYLGFDRNDYPGDKNLSALHRTFSYAGYWLNIPPGSKSNNWLGHRAAVESAGFGFLVLFNGRLFADLKSEERAAQIGASDARNAVNTARHEGFPAATVIFLDQEQGGRMLPEQLEYIRAWVRGVTSAGFRAGIYCSGMVSTDSNRVKTAEDIRRNLPGESIMYWVTNDACPPSPGCALLEHPPRPRDSGIEFAEVWQFAQSPRRKEVASLCTNYARDLNCYPPGVPGVYVDLNTSDSPDPSHGRTR